MQYSDYFLDVVEADFLFLVQTLQKKRFCF